MVEALEARGISVCLWRLAMSYNFFLSTEAGAAYMNFEVKELLKFWWEKNNTIDTKETEN